MRNTHTNFYQDNLEKNNCLDCNKSFIVGEYLAKGININCPYCKSENIEADAYTDREKLESMDMGCLGIYFYKEDEK